MSVPPGLGLPPLPVEAVDPTRDCDTASEAETPAEQQMRTSLAAGDYDGALAVFQSASPANKRMINMAFTASVCSGKHIDTAAVEMLQACAAAGITATPEMHNNVLAALTRKAPAEAVLSWIARMRESSIPLDRVACNIELKAHVAMGDMNAAVKMLSTMMRGATSGPPTPDAVSFNTVIGALASKPGCADKAERLLTSMLDSGFEANTRSFTEVIVAFARASQPTAAGKWLDRMLQSQVPPDTALVNAVLLAYERAGDAEGAIRVLRTIEESVVVDCPNAKPDVVSFNTIISACSKAGLPQRAEESFFLMERRGIVPTQVSFASVVSAHARAGQPAKAQAWLDAMVARGNVADAVSYNTVCAAHARVGDANAAIACFERMTGAGVQATPTTRATLVNALVQAGRPADAQQLLQSLVADGVRLDASSFNPLITLHAKSGRPSDALAILKLMQSARVEPSLVTFNSLASAYATYGDLEATEDALKEALDAGHVLDRYSYGALLQVASKLSGSKTAKERESGKAAARRYVEQMLASGIPINDYLQSMSTRAVGERAWAEMRRKAGSSGGTSAAPSPSRATRQRTAADSAEAPREAPWRPPSSVNSAAPVADDGWETVPSARRRSSGSSGSGGKARGKATGTSPTTSLMSPRAALSPAIRKEQRPPSKTAGAKVGVCTTAVGAPLGSHTSPADVRLVGIQMTRSKSERARLLALAQEVTSGGLAAEDGPSAGTPPGLLPNVPLTRSAYSELALTLGSDMHL
mmetsp:Transcript_35371/g.92858  ORF Transcript_35371/g.92858 Transcript_35371/m.92858 type:complete len:758 (-) Transcript_35371:665-2938(-)